MVLTVGTRVHARDAAGQHHRAVVVPVPRDQRDATGNQTYTTRGDFPKTWLRFASGVVPWPMDAINLAETAPVDP